VATYDDSRYTYEQASLSYDGLWLATPLAGTQPASSGTLTAVVTYRRALAGAQPVAAGSGTLSTHITYHRTLTGAQPSGSGTLTRRLLAYRALYGDQPEPGAALSRKAQYKIGITGIQDPSTGALSRRATLHIRLTGAAPSGTGTLIYGLYYRRTITGFQPMTFTIRYEEPGVTYNQGGLFYEYIDPGYLFYTHATKRALSGLQGGLSGTLSWVWNPYIWAEYQTFVYDRPEYTLYLSVETDDAEVRYAPDISVEHEDDHVEIVYIDPAPIVHRRVKGVGP
jgi:hypothetical protein